MLNESISRFGICGVSGSMVARLTKNRWSRYRFSCGSTASHHVCMPQASDAEAAPSQYSTILRLKAHSTVAHVQNWVLAIVQGWKGLWTICVRLEQFTCMTPTYPLSSRRHSEALTLLGVVGPQCSICSYSTHVSFVLRLVRKGSGLSLLPFIRLRGLGFSSL